MCCTSFILNIYECIIKIRTATAIYTRSGQVVEGTFEIAEERVNDLKKQLFLFFATHINVNMFYLQA